YFFFQAEVGIRDFHVTGVQTCCSSDLYLSRLYELPLKEGCIITDVGSTKKGIVETADRLAGQRKGPVFIGGHPMAGKEKSGVEEIGRASCRERRLRTVRGVLG